jgi:hypothetical protein
LLDIQANGLFRLHINRTQKAPALFRAGAIEWVND